MVEEGKEQERVPMEAEEIVVLDDLKLREIISSGSLDFDDWTSLISHIEKTYPDDGQRICLVYNSFLSDYPLCYGYWRKYAGHKVRLCSVGEVVELFEQAVLAATYSVDVWVDYCSFAALVFEDMFDVRRLFKRALSFVGKDYLCHTLWDKYIEFEFSQQNWSSLAHMYVQTLRFPSKKLNSYYESFKKLVEIWKEEMKSPENFCPEVATEPVVVSALSTSCKQDDIDSIVNELMNPSSDLARTEALGKYINIGERYYQKSVQFNEKLRQFETLIKRPYFHVKPLDVCQLENWHQYLDFAESSTDFDWAVKLYERCLIPCANYPEFWMRYVEFMERKGGREIAELALDRATRTFLKRESTIHMFNARFKEHVGNVLHARAAFLLSAEESDSDFVEYVVRKANMEKRMGNTVAASITFKEALRIAAANEKQHILPLLYINFSRLKYVMTENEDAAMEILIDGIKEVPNCKLLLEELIKFAMLHGGSRHLNLVDSVVSHMTSLGQDVSQFLSMKDREDISRLYIELVDLCGTITDVRKAWYRHIRLFPHSVRTLFRSSTVTKRWKMANEAPQEKPSISEDNDVDTAHPVMAQEQDKKLPTPESSSLLPEQLPDKEHPSLEVEEVMCDHASTDLVQLRESCINMPESGPGHSVKASEPPELDAPQNSIELCNDATSEAQALIETSEVGVQQDSDHRQGEDLKILSLEKLSLDLREDKPSDPVSCKWSNFNSCEESDMMHLTLHEGEIPSNECLSVKRTLDGNDLQEYTMSSGNEPMINQENTVSSKNQPMINQENTMSSGNQPMVDHNHETDRFAYGNRSSTNDAQRGEDAHRQQRYRMSSGRKWHQGGTSDTFRRDSKFRSGRDFRKRLHQQAPQRIPPVERGSHTHSFLGQPPQPLSSPGLPVQQNVHGQQYASAAHFDPMVPQVSTMQDLPPPSIALASQAQPSFQSNTYPEALMSQYSMQNIGQYGNVQNSQAYNNYLWQFYYYQQQLLMWQQQQQMKQQQPQQQQFLEQQYQQQMLQTQILQQQLEQQQLPNQRQEQQQQLQQQEQGQQLQLPQQQQLPQQHELQLQQPQHLLQQQLYQPPQQQFQQQHLFYLQQQQQLQLQQPQPQQQLKLQEQHPDQLLTVAQHPQDHEKERGQTEQQVITSHVLEFKQEASEGHEDENESAEGHQSSAAANRNPDSPFPDPNQLPSESS